MSSSRRRFLRTTAAAAGAFALPQFNIAKAGPSANSKLNLAFIGVGGRGVRNLQGLAAENIVALCDVDDNEAAGGYQKFPGAKRFKDFRVMLDKMGKEIDGVVITTPDHAHFAATMASMELGKHVFCEKPLTHNVWQARMLKRGASHYKVISQMGNQGHATEGIRYIREWYQAGVLGEVKEVLAWLKGPNFDSRYFGKTAVMPPPEEEVPAHLDWELWRGPVAKGIAYNGVYVPKKWRTYYDFGGGILGDWSCHTLDGPFWALDLGMPTRIEAVKREGDGTIACTTASMIRFEFPARGDKPPVTLTWHDGGHRPENRKEWGLKDIGGDGMIMVGDKASLMTGGRPDSPRLIPEEIWRDFRKNVPEKTIPRVKGGHYQEWTSAIKGDGPAPGSSFDYGAELTEMALLGVLAQRFGGVLEYDAKKMKITNRPELNQFLKEPVREGWEYGKGVKLSG
jgi:predicted dehydrogenase